MSHLFGSSYNLMDAIAIAVLLLAMAGHSSAVWCVCKGGVPDTILQKTLDYACGGGGDCNPIRPNGQCYQPNNLKAHCSYAVNSYFQRKSHYGATCDFSGAATITSSDPSSPGCTYPASSSGTGTTTNMPSTTTPSMTTPTTTSPFGTTTPTSTGVFGGAGTGMGPSGANTNTDYSHGGHRLLNNSIFSSSIMLLVSAFILLCV